MAHSATDVSIDRQGNILILTDDGFAASYKNGNWTAKILFDAGNLKDDLFLVEDPAEAEAILNWAKIALKHKV